MIHANFSRFSQLCTHADINPRVALRSWELLARCYSEPHRHYHNLSHVDAMLALVDLPQGDPAMELAIWFHDAVYDPRAGDNEEKSARLFHDCVRGELDDRILADGVRLILATDYSKPVCDKMDEATIRDIDLAILAAEPASYFAYCDAIRNEFIHVPEDDFAVGRRAVLTKFLARQIYQTERFTAFEEAARQNMQSEIERLSVYRS